MSSTVVKHSVSEFHLLPWNKMAGKQGAAWDWSITGTPYGFDTNTMVVVTREPAGPDSITHHVWPCPAPLSGLIRASMSKERDALKSELRELLGLPHPEDLIS